MMDIPVEQSHDEVKDPTLRKGREKGGAPNPRDGAAVRKVG